MPDRVTIVTSGPLVSTPRMLKAADALHEAGYQVHAVCAEQVDWTVSEGEKLRQGRPWSCQVVHWHPRTGRWTYWRSGVRHRLARWLGERIDPERAPLTLLARAACRVAAELIQAVRSRPTDLLYGGTVGGLAITAIAARTLGVPFALDLEDFHSAEHADSESARRRHHLVRAIERRVLPEAAFLTAGSVPIADAYTASYGVRPRTIHNVFALPARAPDFARSAASAPSLRLYWFSQVIGPSRGLEDAIEAAGMLDRPVWLGLLGSRREGYAQVLHELARRVAPKLTIEYLGHRSPDEMVEVARQADVGLALEPGFSRNNDLALSNKLCVYLLAGLAVAATATTGQRYLVESLGEGGFVYPPGDAQALAVGLRRWADDPDALTRARRAAWEAAQRRWHWEHPEERGALLEAVAGVLRSHRQKQGEACASC